MRTKLTMRSRVGGVVLLGLLAACSRDDETASRQETDVNPQVLKADLETIANSRVLLGHQSVGRDVLAGLTTLAREHSVALRIVPIDGVPADPGPGVFHAHIGTNGDPASKFEAFQQLLAHAPSQTYDVAMMKLCYVDLGHGAVRESDALLDRYAATVREIKEQRPDVQLVHITMPLRADPPGRRTKVRRWLALGTSEDADNELRNAFNERLRSRFTSEPLFDLAGVESTRPDGTRSGFARSGRSIDTLAAEYTTDGGHLNSDGQRRAAAEFVRVTAQALRQRS